MLEIILVVLALIAIVGVGIYFYLEMKDHKAANSTDFEKVNKNIEDEEKTRLGNIKYVVDQVNTTNAAMDASYTERLDKLEGTGFGTLISATNPVTGEAVPFKDATATSNLKLMKDVSVVGSMSIKDLEIANRTSTTTKPSFKACGVVGVGSIQAPCIEFPNSAGHTYLTGLSGSNSHVISGSLFKADLGADVTGTLKTDTINNLVGTNALTIQTKNGATIGNTITVGNTPNDGITLTSGTNTIVIKSDTINIDTGDDSGNDAQNATALANIKINSKPLVSISVPASINNVTDLASLAGKRILTY